MTLNVAFNQLYGDFSRQFLSFSSELQPHHLSKNLIRIDFRNQELTKFWESNNIFKL